MLTVLLLVVPALFALLIGVLPGLRDRTVRRLAGVGSVVPLLIGIVFWWRYAAGTRGMLEGGLYRVQTAWFPEPLGATVHLGLDGISLVYLVLTALLAFLSVLYSWEHVRQRERAYYVCLLLMLSAMLGIFLARDLLLFYLFWEAMLLPLYFLVGIWGGSRRLYASMKMVLYTLSGSLLMLVGIVVVFWLHLEQQGFASMAFQDLYQIGVDPWTGLLLFVAFGLAFAIKTPLFPVHTWLPDAHVEAPSAGSVILAGIMLKVGIYGFIRLLIPLFPAESAGWAGFIALLAVIGILYGGLVAWAQEDIKKLVAYSSVSHMGFVVLGLFALNLTGVTGGLLQGAIHGINTGALFLMVGMLYERIHTREIADIRGIARRMPVYSTFFVIFAFASIGLPATNGFVGEFLILVGSFSRFPVLTVFAALGVIVAAIYMLSLVRQCVFGTPSEAIEGTSDLSGLETVTLIPLLILVFWIGLYPEPFLDRLQPSVDELLETTYETTEYQGITTSELPSDSMNVEEDGS